MTEHTDADSAEFEKAWRERPIYMGGVHQKEVAYIWWMQAARRAPAAQVPQVTDEMIEAANEAYCPFGDMELAIQAALAAAPQPPEAEEKPLQEQLDEALQSLEFYKHRCYLLQSIQPRMRDPERTMVCDVLANGHLLQGGDGQPDKARYAPPEAVPVQFPGPVAFALEWTFDGEERGIRLYDDERHCRFDAESDGGVCSPLYTEQQVRQLLADHAAKEKP